MTSAPIDATIHAVVPKFSQALALDLDGYQYSIVLQTPGVPWSALQPGDRLRLWLTPPPVRVERVERV